MLKLKVTGFTLAIFVISQPGADGGPGRSRT